MPTIASTNISSIDPVSMLFPKRIYLKYLEVKHPRGPLTARAELQAAEIKSLALFIKTLEPAEKQSALESAKAMIAYGQAVLENCK